MDVWLRKLVFNWVGFGSFTTNYYYIYSFVYFLLFRLEIIIIYNYYFNKYGLKIKQTDFTSQNCIKKFLKQY